MTMIEEAPVSLADAPVRRLNMIEAINDALDIMLAHDPSVIVMGEDVGYFGGVFRATAGLQKKHGKTRVFDTPISECGIIGVAVGMGAYGLRPVPEIQFADYIYPGLDQLISEAARLRYRSAGEFIAPMTVRSPFGGGIFGGQTHSQSPEALFTHVAGLKTVIPSTPHDAKGLLIAAIEDNDPVIFFEPKRIYHGPFNGYYDKPVEPWSKHRGEFVKRAGFALIASLALHDKSATDAQFVKTLALIERGASDDRNFVKKGVSWAIRSVGRRSKPLHAASLEVAQRRVASDAPAAKWVGRDAVRDLSKVKIKKG